MNNFGVANWLETKKKSIIDLGLEKTNQIKISKTTEQELADLLQKNTNQTSEWISFNNALSCLRKHDTDWEERNREELIKTKDSERFYENEEKRRIFFKRTQIKIMNMYNNNLNAF